MKPEHLKAETYHRRLDGVKNSFRYSVDYVLIEPESVSGLPFLFSVNARNVMAFHDKDHGGKRNEGRGVAWVRDVLQDIAPGISDGWRVLLLAQPKIIGTRFTPVSFWLVLDQKGALRVAIAEVNNTFGERHCYICAKSGFDPIAPEDMVKARKIFHVSPFQPVEGGYRFNFDLSDDKISIRIDYRHEGGGLLATLIGDRRPISNTSILGSIFRRPIGSLRVLGLIHYQALILWLRGALYREKPKPPSELVS